MAHIGFDVDGVLADFHTLYIDHINRQKGTSFSVADITVYELWGALPITMEETFAHIHTLFSEHADSIKPYAAMVPLVRKLAFQHTLFAVTARAAKFEQATVNFLNAHYPSCFSKVYHSDKPKKLDGGKDVICRDMRLDLFVEDCAAYANAIAAVDIPVFLIEKPWNGTQPLHPLVTRVPLEGLEEAIQEALAEKT